MPVSQADIDADIRAGELVTEMAALPAWHPDRAAVRDRAIEAWMPMARRLTRRYANRGEDLDDLFQAASVGLVKAVDRFDPDNGADFPGFAIPTILGEIRRHFRDRAWSVRIPRRLQELRLAVSAAQSELDLELQHAPTVADVAARLEVSEEEVLEALEAARAYRSTSLSTPVSGDGDLTLGDTFGSEDHGYALAELNADLPKAIDILDDREKRIVMLRFYGNLSQTRIAEELGISQMHVSRLLATALRKMRRKMS